MRPHWKSELIKAIRPRYRRSSRPEKGRILDELCAATGYHRKYAIRLLRRPLDRRPLRPRGRPRLYASSLDRVLAGVWHAMGFPGAGKLRAALPAWLPWMRRRFGIDRRTADQLLTMSCRTIDRRLQPFRERLRRWEEGPRAVAAGRRGETFVQRPPPVLSRPGGSGTLAARSELRYGDETRLRRRARMEISVRKQKGVMIIGVAGAMVLQEESFPIMKRVVKELKEGQKKFILDLGKVEKMDSSGVGELVAVNVAIKEKAGQLHLANFHENVGKILQMALIHKLVPTFDTQKEAMEAFELQQDPAEALDDMG